MGAGMLDAILEPLQQGITQRALLELLILGVVCGPLGVWVVLYRQSYAAESIAHAMLPGLVIAALISAPLGLGAAAGLMVAAAGIAVASRQSAVSPDVAVAVTVTTLFGAGTLLALSPAVPLRLGELLFGDPLSVSNGDLIGSACLAAVGLLAMACGSSPADALGLRSGYGQEPRRERPPGRVVADRAARIDRPDRRSGAGEPPRRRDRGRSGRRGPEALLPADERARLRGRRRGARRHRRGLRQLLRRDRRGGVGRPVRGRDLRHRADRGAPDSPADAAAAPGEVRVDRRRSSLGSE